MINKEAIGELRDIYKEIDDVFIFTGGRKIEALDLAIKALEERPQGEWIYNDYGNGCGNWHCSVCDHIPYYATKYMRFLIFCPNCGAQMIGGGANE